MSIIRIQKNSNYSIIANIHLQDKSLSWKAKGLLTYLLSKPDEWQTYISHLKKQSTDGKASTAAGIKELIDAGYINRHKIRNSKGHFIDQIYTVYEMPVKNKSNKNNKTPQHSIKKSDYPKSDYPKSDYPKSDYPKSDYPISENRPLLNTDKEINTDKNKKHIYKKSKDFSHGSNSSKKSGSDLDSMKRNQNKVYLQEKAKGFPFGEPEWDSTMKCYQYPNLPFNLERCNPIQEKICDTSRKTPPNESVPSKDKQSCQDNKKYKRIGQKLISLVEAEGRMNPRTNKSNYWQEIKKAVKDLSKQKKISMDEAFTEIKEIIYRYEKWIGKPYIKEVFGPKKFRDSWFDLKLSMDREENKKDFKNGKVSNGLSGQDFEDKNHMRFD